MKITKFIKNKGLTKILEEINGDLNLLPDYLRLCCDKPQKYDLSPYLRQFKEFYCQKDENINIKKAVLKILGGIKND